MLKSLLFPTSDPRQLHRMRRWMMAASASMMAVGLFFAAYLLGLLGREAFETAALLTGFFVVLFYALFRSGLNLRFRDASLTTPQIVAATLVILFAMSQSKDGQGILALIYVVAFLFGVFRLSTRNLLALTAFVAVCYGLVIGVQWYPGAGADPVGFKRMVLNWIVLTAVLAFCSILGGYVSKLRKYLTERRVLLEGALQRIEHMAARDELTELLNRRSLIEFLVRQKSRADRFGMVFSVPMLDIDNFKVINDTHGHHAGDVVLRTFARAAAAKLRQTDVFGRYGGEEFLAILEQTPTENLKVVAEGICTLARELNFDDLAPGLRITVSIGGTDYYKAEDWQATVERADQALYQAKESGRDRFVLAPVSVQNTGGKSTFETQSSHDGSA
ncbi:MAG TPA: GGDEF domain-containing protein [Burkholderiales bacterium]|nr:GGDEF domain-containing protein [Burkholderiales bacterium]